MSGTEPRPTTEDAPMGEEEGDLSSSSDEEREDDRHWNEDMLAAAAKTLDEDSGGEGRPGTSREDSERPIFGSKNHKPLVAEAELGEDTSTGKPGPWAGRFQRPSTDAYDTIREANTKKYEAVGLYEKNGVAGFTDSFRNLGDGRHTLVKEVNNNTKMRNYSYSFDVQKFVCIGCAAPHPVGKLGQQKAPFFLLSDQCMPPLCPPLGTGGCITVLRVEDGSLGEIVEALEEAIRGRWLPQGTGVAISAGGHLARVGVASYAQDLVEAINKLKRILPPASFVAHGPVAFARGISDPGIIRAVSDICTWQCALAKEGVVGDFLPISNKASIRLIERKGTVGIQTPYSYRVGLPANMATGPKRIWHSDGPEELPLATLPLDEDDEAELLYYLCTEANRMLGSNLDTQLCTKREVVEGGASRPENLIFVGNRHAERMATAAAAMGKEAAFIPLPNSSEVEVHNCARSVREKIAEMPPVKRANSLLVFAILDERLYMARSSEGGLTPCNQVKKGIVHVEGRLTLALETSWLKEVLGQYAPLLEAGEGLEGVLLTPFPRYMDGPCCERPAHMVGYTKENQRQELMATIHKARRYLKYIVKAKGVRVANMATVVADSSAGWADSILAHIGAYQEVVAALVTEIPGRLAERAVANAQVEAGGGSGGGQKRKVSTGGPAGKRHYRGGGGDRRGGGCGSSDSAGRGGWGGGARGGGGRGGGSSRGGGGYGDRYRRPGLTGGKYY